MLILTLIIAVTTGNLTGFWHSEPDLSKGYESCYFFWDTGEFAYLRSIDEGTLYMGDWVITGDELVLNIWDAMTLDGIPMGIYSTETALELIIPAFTSRLMMLNGESFYLLDRNPLNAILSLVPAYGMTGSERETFSTYD